MVGGFQGRLAAQQTYQIEPLKSTVSTQRKLLCSLILTASIGRRFGDRATTPMFGVYSVPVGWVPRG